MLQPGESRRVTLRVPVERLGFHLEDGTYLVEPGEIQLFVGGSSVAEGAGTVQITEGLRMAPGEKRAPPLKLRP
jgi:beta-glucosidase